MSELCLTFSEKMVVDPKSAPIPGKGFQIFAACIANLLAITDGMTMGWTSPMIPYFLSERSHIKMSHSEAELIETFILIGAVSGLPVTVYLVNKIGRRKSMMLSCFLLVIFWGLLGLANQVVYIYVGRFGMGLGLNMAFVAMPMYIGEISHPKIRGLLTASTFVFMLIGIITVYSIGPYVPYIVSPIFASCLLVIELIVFFFLPESPHYLLMRNKPEAAKKSLERFRGGQDVEDEMASLQASMDKSQEESGKIIDLISSSTNRKSLLIMVVINFAQLFGSAEVIIMNLHEILQSAGSLYMDPSISAIVFAVIMLIAAVMASSIVDKFGRKFLLLVSTFTSALCVLALAVFFHLKILGYDVRSVSWIPVASIMAYAACFKFGLGTVGIVITAEIFSQKMKAFGMTFADGAYVVASIAALQVFFYTKDNYGMHVPFYIFSGCLFAVAPFFIFCVPETKGKSFEQIQDILQKPMCS